MTILPKTRMQEAISILWEGVCASVYMHNIYIYIKAMDLLVT